MDTLYARYLSGEISEAEEKALKQSGEWAELEKIIAAMEQLSLPAYDKKAAFAKLKDRRLSPKKEEATIRFLNWKYVAGLAASIILFLGIWNFMGAGIQEIQSPLASNITHVFGDNSRVKLNAGSTIRFDEGDWEKERKVELIGEGFFEIEKGLPFRVETQNGRIEVLGTSFNVRSWGKNLSVECYTGKVQVSNTLGEQVFLNPGFSVISVNGKLGGLMEFAHEKAYWQTGISRFYEDDFGMVIEELERQFAVRVQHQIPARKFSGQFDHKNLAKALDQICKPMGLSFEISSDGKLVQIK